VTNPNLFTEASRSKQGNVETIVDPHRGIVLSHVVASPRLFITILAMPCTRCGVYKHISLDYSLS
jgi:hypothetical protein